MAIVDAERVNRYLSFPQWSPAQWAECADLCAEREAELASLLGGTRITPTPHSETAVILGSGLVATTYPVYSVSSLDGTSIPSGQPLPTGWRVVNHWLYRDAPSYAIGSYTSFPAPNLVNRIENVGVTTVTYMAGWGDDPVLRDQIVKKVAAVMLNRHDDAVGVTDDGQLIQPTRSLPQEWTMDEINTTMGIYRNLGAWR